MREFKQVLIEALLVGVLVVIIGIILSRILSGNTHPRIDSPYLLSMVVCLLLIGMVIHLGFEVFGINEQFCKIAYN